MAPVKWMILGVYRTGCEGCGARRDLLTVYYVRPWEGWHAERAGANWLLRVRRACLDRARCRARRDKRRARSRARSSLLVVEEPRAPDAPAGTCRWCGVVIELVPEAVGARRRRRYHRGDRWEVGDLDCLSEYERSRTWAARIALQRRGDPCCVDCGAIEGAWEADHEVPLEDGGEHSLENLVRRCVRCHRDKTARENRERAQRRRDERAGVRARS